MFLLDILFIFKSLAQLVAVHFANSSMKLIAPRLLKNHSIQISTSVFLENKAQDEQVAEFSI